MVNRIRMTNNSLKVSLPGYNVDSAAQDQLAFDSDRTTGHFWLAGRIVIPANRPSYLSTQYFNVPFGRVMCPLRVLSMGRGVPNDLVAYSIEEMVLVNYSNGTRGPDTNNCKVFAYDPQSFAYDYNFTAAPDGYSFMPRSDRDHMRLWYQNPRNYNVNFDYRIMNFPVV